MGYIPYHLTQPPPSLLLLQSQIFRALMRSIGFCEDRNNRTGTTFICTELETKCLISCACPMIAASVKLAEVGRVTIAVSSKCGHVDIPHQWSLSRFCEVRTRPQKLTQNNRKWAGVRRCTSGTPSKNNRGILFWFFFFHNHLFSSFKVEETLQMLHCRELRHSVDRVISKAM